MDDREVRGLVARTDALLNQLESLEDGEAKSNAVETIQILFELYGEGLRRILEQTTRSNMTGLIDAYKQDELVSHLLLMHDLHPDPIETRVQQALDEVRPYMESHGGNVELLGVKAGIAYLRLVGSCHGCLASSTTMKLAVEKAVHKFAPDLLAVEAEGAVEAPPRPMEGFIPVSNVGTAARIKQNV
jgi:Fe-S cluster biogenesis protein NfuA